MPHDRVTPLLRLAGQGVGIRHFVIFKDVTNHRPSGQNGPTDQYTKRIQLRNDFRSCRETSAITSPKDAENTCICLIKCFFAEKFMQFK